MQSNAQTAPLAVHSVDEFVFSVPDLEEARRFYSSFGLDVRVKAAAWRCTPMAIRTAGRAS